MSASAFVRVIVSTSLTIAITGGVAEGGMTAAHATPAPHPSPTHSSTPPKAPIKAVPAPGGVHKIVTASATLYGPYVFFAGGTNQAMNVSGYGGSHASVVLWPWGRTTNSEWYVEYSNAGGQYYHPGHNLDLCLDLPSRNTANGTKMWVYNCNGTLAQRFQTEGLGGTGWNIWSMVNSSKCLDVHTRNTGERVQIWTCNGSNAQAWDETFLPS